MYLMFYLKSIIIKQLVVLSRNIFKLYYMQFNNKTFRIDIQCTWVERHKKHTFRNVLGYMATITDLLEAFIAKWRK